MTRAIHASVVTEFAKDDFNMVSLLFLDFTTPIYITDAGRDVDSGGQTYDTSVHILNISSVSESADLRVGTLRIDLSGAEQTYISLLLNNDYIDIQVKYYKALYDDTWTLIGDALLIFDGNISGFKIVDSGKKSMISIECASHWANFDTINGRRSNDSSQKIHFSTDDGMEFASHTERDIRWGKKNESTSGGGGQGGGTGNLDTALL